MKNVYLNEGLKEIGESAFGMTSSLKEITLPSTLETLAGGAFVLSGLENVVIPGSVKTIGKQAFSCCSQLKSVVIEEGVEKIETGAFEGLNNLQTVDLPKSLIECEWGVFQGSTNITVYIPVDSAIKEYLDSREIKYVIK